VTIKNNNGRRRVDIAQWTGDHWNYRLDDWSGEWILAWRPIPYPDPYWGEY